MIIDTESHVIYRVFPRESNPDRSPVFRATWHEYSGDLFVAEMDRAGVDCAFLISYDGEDIRWYLERMEGATVNDCVGGRKYTLQAVRKYPDRFFWFATLKDPRRPDALDLMQRDLDDGAVGMKIFPPYFPLKADDPLLMQVYRRLADANRRVILSFEDVIPPETPTEAEYFEQLDRVAREFPDLKIQVNHAGCTDPLKPEAEIIFRVTEKHDNILLSTAWLGKVWDDESEYPYPTFLRRLEKLKDEVGADKLMWATDWPWLEQYMNYPQAVDSIRKHASFFTEDEKRRFLGDNAWQFIEELVPGYQAAPIFEASRQVTGAPA